MPVQVESQGQLQEFLGVLRERRWQVLLPALFVLALGSAAAVIVPKKYEVKTRIELREQRVEGDYQLRNPNESASAQEIVNIEHHVKHLGRVQKLIQEMGWEDYNAIADPDPRIEATKRRDFIDKVLADLDVAILEKSRSQGSTFVDITFKDVDGARAELFLNRLTKLALTEVIDRDRAVLSQELQLAQNIQAQAFNEWQLALQREIALQRESGLSFTQTETQGGSREEDPVFKRLSEAVDQQAKVETSLTTVRAQISSLRAAWEEEPAQRPKEQQQAGVDFTEQIAALQSELAAFQTEQRRLKPANTRYQQLTESITQTEKKIEKLELQSKQPQTFQGWESNPRKQDLRDQIGLLEVQESGLVAELEALKARIEKDRAEHDQRVQYYGKLEELRADRRLKESIHNNAAAVERQKRAAVDTLKSAFGTPYEVAEEAIAPSSPSEPNPWVIVAFSLVAGLALGLGIAVLSEYSRSCYRSVADIGRVMDLPVLGVVQAIVTGEQRRRARALRLLTAASAMVLIGGLFFVTWSYAERQSYLPTELLGAIEDLRMKLR